MSKVSFIHVPQHSWGCWGSVGLLCYRHCYQGKCQGFQHSWGCWGSAGWRGCRRDRRNLLVSHRTQDCWGSSGLIGCHWYSALHRLSSHGQLFTSCGSKNRDAHPCGNDGQVPGSSHSRSACVWHSVKARAQAREANSGLGSYCCCRCKLEIRHV